MMTKEAPFFAGQTTTRPALLKLRFSHCHSFAKLSQMLFWPIQQMESKAFSTFISHPRQSP
jgi:hypothetical protein